MRFINLIFLREKEIVFRKQNLPFQFHNNPKNDDKMITTINKTKQQFKEFYHNIEEIKLTDNEMKKYLVLVYQCAISYLKNKKNKSSLIKKLYRSKVFNTIEVKEINPYLQTKLGQRSNRFLVLGIDEIVNSGDNIEIRQNPKRRRFIQYALNSIEKKDFSSFLLFGPRNSGKTFLVSIYAKKLAELKQNFSVAFIN